MVSECPLLDGLFQSPNDRIGVIAGFPVTIAKRLAAIRRAAMAITERTTTAENLAQLAQQRFQAGQDSEETKLLAQGMALAARAQKEQKSAAAMRAVWINAKVALGAGWRNL